MNRLMVTGGAGFIGANFVRYWLAHHPRDRIVVVDALTYAGNRANLDGVLSARCSLEVENICDTERMTALIHDECLDTVVHFAAESHVDRSIEGPDAFVVTNVIGTHSLLKAARRNWLPAQGSPAHHRFHHVSTDEVYGSLSDEDPAFTESTAYAPNSPYSASKASSDFLVRAYHHTYGLQTTISNCSNNYGPRHFPEKLIPLMILDALRGQSLPVYGNGENIRDWLYVDDHARGIECVLERGQPGSTYNIGGCNEWRNIDIVKRICQVLDQRFDEHAELAARYPACPAARGESCVSLISFVTDRAGHDYRYAIDNRRIRETLGFEPAISFEEGIESTIDWYLDNRGWWSAVLDGSYLKRAAELKSPQTAA